MIIKKKTLLLESFGQEEATRKIVRDIITVYKQEYDGESDSDALNIGGDISLDTLDVFDMTNQTILNDDPMIDIEVL